MIAHLRGPVTTVSATTAVFDIGGLGMEAHCTARALSALRPGSEGRVVTQLVVRQEQYTLYGFLDETERQAFEMLTSVNSIGPKMAMGLLSLLEPPALVAAIRSEDIAALTRAPGIGKKSAERILVELSDKILTLGVAEPAPATDAPLPDRPPWRDQVSAGLQGLGWSAKEADAACEAIEPLAAEDPSIGVPQLMRAALQALAR